jgi:hydroxymethylglutaryl-CoA lyase
MNASHWPERVILREVGLRDGLQSIARTLPTSEKLQWIQGAYDAGLREIEVGSFVPPRLLPQLADTAELVTFAKTLPGLCVSVLVWPRSPPWSRHGAQGVRTSASKWA